MVPDPSTSDDSPRFAPIEDLDPEPQARVARGHRQEWIVGLVLVLAIAGFASGQWWLQQAQRTHYQAGVAAAARYDWPAAATAYNAAGSYEDAAARAKEAAGLAAERDQKYAQATQAIAGGDWPAAFAALQRVTAITPGYRDTATLLPRAEAETIPLALTGTIVLRGDAQPPGLYTYAAGGWQYLPGSDAHSQALAACPDGSILYDAADPAATPAPAIPAPDGGPARSPRFAGRRLLSGVPGAPAPRRILILNPAGYDAFHCTATGVWALEPNTTDSSGNGSGYGGDSVPLLPTTLTTVYQAFDRPALLTPRLPGAGWRVLALAPDGSRLLAAQVNGTDLQTAQVQLALIALDGSVEPLPKFEPGPLLAATFSPDSRYLVLTLLAIEDGSLGRRDTFLVYAQRVPLQWDDVFLLGSMMVDWQSPAGRLAGADPFLLHGPQQGNIVVSTSASDTSATLTDPSNLRSPFGWIRMGNGLAGLRFSNSSPTDAGVILDWLDPARAGDGSPSFLAYIDPTGHVTQAQPAVAPNLDLWYAWLRGSSVVYETRADDSNRLGSTYTLSAQSLVSLSDPAAQPATVFTGTLGVRPYPAADPTARVYLGPGLLTYVTPSGQLRARGYTGDVDVLLDGDVQAIYPLHPGDSP